MPPFRVSKKAHNDLISIARYTELQWGIPQRNHYLQEIDDCFNQLAIQPEMGMACDDIRTGYRKFPHGSHLIFYRQGVDQIVEIIRILHKSMDVESKLPA